MKKYKAVIYDLDGTVLNTIDMNLYPLIRIIKEELNEDRTFDEVKHFYAYPGLKTIEMLGIKDVKNVYARWVKYVNEYEQGAVLYDGFETVFETLNGKVKQAIASSKRRGQYEIDFVSKNLEQYIETAVLAEDTLKHKPDPEPILECIRRLNVKPEEVLYIGDTSSDSVASKRAGVDFGYARWGSLSEEGIKDPNFIFYQPLDILNILKNDNE